MKDEIHQLNDDTLANQARLEELETVENALDTIDDRMGTTKPRQTKSKRHPAIQDTAKPLRYNPLDMMLNGQTPPHVIPDHLPEAKVSNLYYEYAQNEPSLKGFGIRGEHIAEVLAKKGLIMIDDTTGRYKWLTQPLTKAEFLRMIADARRTTKQQAASN